MRQTAKVVVELTDRCNLACGHCFSGRHGGTTLLGLDIVQRILRGARDCGFQHISFTGGEPTLHPSFHDIVESTCEAGYTFSFVSNGATFPDHWPRLRRHRAGLRGVTFSCDGPTEAIHDGLRGAGSFRRLLQAVSICVAREVPFTLNSVVTRENMGQVGGMVDLASKLGSAGLRFGHLLPHAAASAQARDLSPAERVRVEAEVRALAEEAPVPVDWAPGTHSTDLFPCSPLNGLELNVDCRGRMTKCCHLSGHERGTSAPDVVADLAEVDFAAAWKALTRENERFRRRKLDALRDGQFEDRDFFACWYCQKHYGKLSSLDTLSEHPWALGSRKEAADA